MKDFQGSTLWGVSGFERHRIETGTSGYARLDSAAVLPASLMADLEDAGVGYANDGGDILETAAACVRHREAASLLLSHQDVIWPLTLFPTLGVYHCPRDMVVDGSLDSLSTTRMVLIEPPSVAPADRSLYDEGVDSAHYRPLWPLLWTLALYGPRRELLTEISGAAAYRAVGNPAVEGLTTPGALGSAVQRLRRESVSLKTMATWPGVTVERASRLLNALYLASGLMVTRSNPAARGRARSRSAFGWTRSAR